MLPKKRELWVAKDPEKPWMNSRTGTNKKRGKEITDMVLQIIKLENLFLNLLQMKYPFILL